MPSTLKLFHRLTGTMDQPRSTGTHPESVLSPAPITLDSPPASPLIHPRRAAPIFLTHGGAKPLKLFRNHNCGGYPRSWTAPPRSCSGDEFDAALAAVNRRLRP